MNDLETPFVIQNYPTLVAVFVIMVIVISVLTAVIVAQTRNRQLANRPSYGFLGKPIVAMFFLVLSIGSVSLVYYSTQTSQSVDNVSADRELNLEIKEEKIEGLVYRFNILPKINTDDWGSATDEFNVYWTISNTESFTRIELDLTEKNTGGVVIELKQGLNIIRAVVFNADISKEVVKEIQI